MKHGFRCLRAGIVVIGLLGLFVLPLGRGHTEPESSPTGSGVELKTVKYRDLVEAVKAHRGKVVAVDVWATWCPPCVAKFPHLVALHGKYKDQGLVCMSVSLDVNGSFKETEDPRQVGKERALKFLTEKKATFPNYLLDEPFDVWQGRRDVNGPPIWFVFDRQGRRAGKWDISDVAKPIGYDEIDKTVIKLLQAKP